MNIKPIKSKKDYEQAMLRLENIFDAKKATTKGDELEILSLLIEKYEDDNFAIDLPDPIEAIEFRMEQMGMTQTDLANIIGQKSRASEILNRKRKLSLDMIRQLHKQWRIPTEVLVQAY
ncbi:MAG: helix-turn-helix domain-containing protein [Ferruginibacter sp.]